MEEEFADSDFEEEKPEVEEESYYEKKAKVKEEEEEYDDVEDEKPIVSSIPSKEEYRGLMAKANKQPNKYKKRMDVARAKKFKQKAKKAEQKRRREEAEALGTDAPPIKVPHTLETLRKPDETELEGDDYENYEVENDDFAPYFEKEYVPKILITSSHNPNLKTRLFMKELERVVPNSEVFLRRKATVKKMIAQSVEKNFTDVMIINEDKKEPTSLLISHLPSGPTCFFRLSNVKLTKHIKVSKEEYDTCRITNPNPRIIAVCDKPHKLMYFTITFRSFTPQPGGLEFRPGQDYYFISTSSRDDLHRRVGGRCSSHNMKVVFKVCCHPGETSARSTTIAPAALPPAPRFTTSSISTAVTTPSPRRPIVVYTSSTSTTSTTSTTRFPPPVPAFPPSTRYPPKKTQYNTNTNVKPTSKKKELEKHQNEVVKNEELTSGAGRSYRDEQLSSVAALCLVTVIRSYLQLH